MVTHIARVSYTVSIYTPNTGVGGTYRVYIKIILTVVSAEILENTTYQVCRNEIYTASSTLLKVLMYQ